MKRLIFIILFLPLIGLSQSYEGTFYVNDSTQQFGKILPKGQQIINRDVGDVWVLDSMTSSDTMSLHTWDYKTIVGGNSGIDAGGVDVNLNRGIARTYNVGDIIPGRTVEDFIDYIYYSEPSITLSLSPTTTIYEVGTTNPITLSGVTTNYGDVLSDGAIKNSTGTVTYYEFDDAEDYTFDIIFTPKQTPADTFDVTSYSFRTYQTYDGSSVFYSSTKTINGVYPYFSLISSTDYISAAPDVIYDDFLLSKSVVASTSSKAASFTGTGYIYFLQDRDYSVLTQIKNPSDLDEFASFTRYEITVTSTDRDDDYVAKTYYMYKSNSIKYSLVGYTYTFIQ